MGAEIPMIFRVIGVVLSLAAVIFMACLPALQLRLKKSERRLPKPEADSAEEMVKVVKPVEASITDKPAAPTAV